MPDKNISVIIWLVVLAVLIFGILLVGGITRLSNSGLSIVNWQPLMGVIPPINESDWNEVFERYKEFPEYQIINSQMTLSEFKTIYFWEYMHRIMGRLAGVVFLIPWIFFNIRKRFTAKFNFKLLGLFLLGGAQGVLGWYMVQSGLVDMPRVSHFRLAAHLALALTLLGATAWQIQNLRFGTSKINSSSPHRLRRIALMFTTLVSLQIFYGALVAGLDAGIGYNTFPKMGGSWIPPHMFSLEPWWSNLFNNHITVHFLHRTIGWLILLSAVGLWSFARKLPLVFRQQLSISVLGGIVSLQFVLGILTVVFNVPLVLAVFHQATAALLLISAVNTNHALRIPQKTLDDNES